MKRKFRARRVRRRVKRRTRTRSRYRRGRVATPTRLTLKRTFYSGSWDFNATVTNGWWRYHTFTTADINNFAELAAFFDMYKINGIRQTWRPAIDNVANTLTGTVTNPQAYAHTVIDPDSTVLPSGVYSQAAVNAFMEQGDRVKTHTLNRPFSVYFKPKIVNDIGGDAFTTVPSRFLRSTNLNAAHRGYHMLLQFNSMVNPTTPIGGNLRLDSFITVYFTLRGQK